MIQVLFNWKTWVAVIAIIIVSATIFYSRFLAKKIADEERVKVEQWVEAGNLLVNDPTGVSDRLVSIIITQNKSIPIIVTDENNNILDHANLDSLEIINNPGFLKKKLEQFQSQNLPVEWTNPLNPSEKNLYYYGNTNLLNHVKYYPIVQLLIIGLFIAVTLVTLNTSFRSTQNQVWVGMAKETAHQLGTPITSLQGWIEMLKGEQENERIVKEMEKDIDRLRLVSDRFGKIGSAPQLENSDIVHQVNNMVDYIRKRAPGKIQFNTHYPQEGVTAHISPPLFDWVIENLLKNALDAMEGKGAITVTVNDSIRNVVIDIADTGKGIAGKNLGRVFRPGFTTKKRGWGLGLSLSKRIIEQYHKGQLFVKFSEQGKGTTFRIVLIR